MKKCNIPVAVFLFKRKETSLKIIKQIAKVEPPRVYLLSDEGRNEAEKELVKTVRNAVEKEISWECEVIKFYAEQNIGVYENIGLGAKKVLEREERAIFLEDDNYPELSFFQYAEELLERYKDSEEILWICGTNYLGTYRNKRNDSYYFTRHLLPCGWATWSDKFLKYYDGELETWEEKKENFRNTYKNRNLLRQQEESIQRERNRKRKGQKFGSWDYQMLFSLRSNDLYGIAPSKNQIRNIGADEFSIHGGTSLNMVMTNRFCEIPTERMEFPLRHPDHIEVDPVFEKRTGKIILLPLKLRIKGKLNNQIKRILEIEKEESLTEEIKRRMRNGNFIIHK